MTNPLPSRVVENPLPSSLLLNSSSSYCRRDDTEIKGPFSPNQSIQHQLSPYLLPPQFQCVVHVHSFGLAARRGLAAQVGRGRVALDQGPSVGRREEEASQDAAGDQRTCARIVNAIEGGGMFGL